MRTNTLIVNFEKFLRLVQVRNYRGKYLTSYQKKISTNEKHSKLISDNKSETVSIIAKLSFEKNNSLDQYETASIDKKCENKNLDLLEASKVYLTADDDYRKLLLYGSENSEIASSNFNCSGCGSNLNCESVKNPGFIPYEVFERSRENELFMKDALCVRCFFLSNNLDPLDVSLDKYIYNDIIAKQLKQFNSGIIMLLADMSDLPFSIPENLDFEAFKSYRFILVGNKIDLLSKPKDFSWYKQCLLEAAKQRGIAEENILFVHLISAKSCELIDKLIDRILAREFLKNEPIFMIGSTNSGKSSVFNRLLKSDLCKTIAKSHVKDALISNLPGTTLNMIRFPITNSSAMLLNRRWQAKQMLSSDEFESSTKTTHSVIESTKLIENNSRGQSFNELATYSYSNDKILSNVFDSQLMKLEYDPIQEFDESKITTNKWFYDTPGYINPDQIINYLPKEELDMLYSNEEMAIPKIYVLKPGFSIIMQNLGRIDVVESQSAIYLSVHARLPVEIVDTDDIVRYFDENEHFTFYSFKKNLSQPLLDKIKSTVPNFTPGDGLLPDMVPVDMDITTGGFYVVSADVVLSSIGWVGISGAEDKTCKIRAWTPASIGCIKRMPPLIPDAVKRRTKRKAHSREFVVK